MYEFEARIRYSEVDFNGKLTWMSLLNYFQDTSTFQSEDLSVGVRFLTKQGFAWVLNAWQIDVVRLPELADHVILGTIPYEIKGFMGFRNFYMKDKKTGEMLAVANSIWTLMDIKNMRPSRVTQEMKDAYKQEPKLEMEYLDRKILFTSDGRYQEPVEVKPHHLDTNHHVNNGQYVQMALEYLPEDFKIKRLRAEYKKSALLSDRIVPVVYTQSSGIGVSLKTQDGEVFTNVEFQGEHKDFK